MLGCPTAFVGLLDRVHDVNRETPTPRAKANRVIAGLESVGRATVGFKDDAKSFLEMLGAIGISLFSIIVRPRTLRLTSTVHHLDRVGWQAIPIMLLITFLIGGIIAQQGIFHFRKFGADAYVVDMVGILVLREIGVLIVAIMVAGRSGSAYTAELGSMKMREEIDALRTMGFDPVEVLILPRIVALDLRAADAGLHRLDGRALRRRPGGLAVWRHEPGDFHCPAAGSDLGHAFQGRHDQGAIHGAGDRRRRLQRRPEGQGQRRIAGPADHDLGGEVDLPGDRARWRVRHLLCLDRDVIGWMQRVEPIANRRCATSWSDSAEDRARSSVARSPPRRNPRLGRRVGRRKVGSVANDHRPYSETPRPDRSDGHWNSTMPTTAANPSRSDGGGASCSSKARCSPR